MSSASWKPWMSLAILLGMGSAMGLAACSSQKNPGVKARGQANPNANKLGGGNEVTDGSVVPVSYMRVQGALLNGDIIFKGLWKKHFNEDLTLSPLRSVYNSLQLSIQGKKLDLKHADCNAGFRSQIDFKKSVGKDKKERVQSITFSRSTDCKDTAKMDLAAQFDFSEGQIAMTFNRYWFADGFGKGLASKKGAAVKTSTAGEETGTSSTGTCTDTGKICPERAATCTFKFTSHKLSGVKCVGLGHDVPAALSKDGDFIELTNLDWTRDTSSNAQVWNIASVTSKGDGTVTCGGADQPKCWEETFNDLKVEIQESKKTTNGATDTGGDASGDGADGVPTGEQPPAAPAGGGAGNGTGKDAGAGAGGGKGGGAGATPPADGAKDNQDVLHGAPT